MNMIYTLCRIVDKLVINKCLASWCTLFLCVVGLSTLYIFNMLYIPKITSAVLHSTIKLNCNVVQININKKNVNIY